MLSQIHSRYDPTAPTKERRDPDATAKGIPQGFSKQAHYPNLSGNGTDGNNPDLDSAHGADENTGYNGQYAKQEV